jgi:tripartite-type tricarboxylate transporter receptor subunit TctC
VVVENRTGAGGRLAAQQLKNAPASQNVLMLANPAIMVVAPLVFKDNGYDADTRLPPVSQVNDYEFGLAVAQRRAGQASCPTCWPGCAPTRKKPTSACPPPAACRTSLR